MSFSNVAYFSCWPLVLMMMILLGSFSPSVGSKQLGNSSNNDSSDYHDIEFITLERANCSEDYDCGGNYNDGKKCYDKKCIDCHLEYTTSKVCTDGSDVNSMIYIAGMIGVLLAVIGGIAAFLACCWFRKGCPMHMAHHHRKEMDKLMDVAIKNAAIHKSGGSRSQSGSGTAKNSTGAAVPGAAGTSAGAGTGVGSSGSPSQVAPAPF